MSGISEERNESAVGETNDIIKFVRAMYECVALADCTLAYCSICHEHHPVRFVHLVSGVFVRPRTVCNGCWAWLLYEARRIERVAPPSDHG